MIAEPSDVARLQGVLRLPPTSADPDPVRCRTSSGPGAVVLGRIGAHHGTTTSVGLAASFPRRSDGTSPVLAAPIAVLAVEYHSTSPTAVATAATVRRRPDAPGEAHHRDSGEQGERRRGDHEVAIEEDRPCAEITRASGTARRSTYSQTASGFPARRSDHSPRRRRPTPRPGCPKHQQRSRRTSADGTGSRLSRSSRWPCASRAARPTERQPRIPPPASRPCGRPVTALRDEHHVSGEEQEPDDRVRDENQRVRDTVHRPVERVPRSRARRRRSVAMRLAAAATCRRAPAATT